MIGWLNLLTYSICSAMLLMMLFGIAFSAFTPGLNRWSRRYFIVLFTLHLLCVVCVFLDVILYINPNMAAVERVVYFFEFLFLSLQMMIPTPFVLHSSGERDKDSLLFRVVSALWILSFIMLIIAQFTDVFYYVTPDNHFFRGSLYTLMALPLIAMSLLNTASVIKRRKKIKKKNLIALLVYLVPLTIATIIHTVYFDSVFLVLAMVICAMTMFGMILTNNIAQYMRQQREIANQRASVMVLQMRPHFIYNTMMGIYYLCDQDPGKAKQVTLDFTTYLRKNFTAIGSENTIPFRDELEHTRAYLAVEQAQFEDVLFVSFDTPHTMFRVPPLTLQPIVENAVKHGMKSSSDPIHISVVTRQTETSSEIIVEDDGPGFEPVDNNEPHIALNNIQQRLALMCKGTLTISSREGGGTSVKVTIPASSW